MAHPTKQEGVYASIYIHRAVAQSFIANPLGLPEINHKDGNTYNNNVTNLEWCTRRYNAQYSKNLTRHFLGVTAHLRNAIWTDKLKLVVQNSGLSPLEIHSIGSHNNKKEVK